MNNKFLVTSVTNWSVDSSLESALKIPYMKRLGKSATLFIVNNDYVDTFSQMNIEIKEEHRVKEFYGLKLVIKDKVVDSSIKSSYEALKQKLTDSGFDLMADSMTDINQQVVEVYAISYTERKLLKTFEATQDDMEDIVYNLEDCPDAWNIISSYE